MDRVTEKHQFGSTQDSRLKPSTLAHMKQTEKIDSSAITVVIQGPTLYDAGNENSKFHQCIQSIRTYLPKAEIIVSTWKGQACNAELVDLVIYNDEPGTITTSNHQPWNYNKMIRSTINGLHHATREYALKLRADLKLSGDNFCIRHETNPSARTKQYKIVDQSIIITNIYTRNPASFTPLLFHPSDITQFGRTADLINLWNREIVDLAEIKTRIGLFRPLSFLAYTGLTVVPEQALMIGWLKSNGHTINLPYPGYLSRQYIEASEISLSVNFHMIDWQESGIEFPTRFTKNPASLQSTYDAKFFNSLAGIYADESNAQQRVADTLKVARTSRITAPGFWIDLLVTPIALLSPKLFLHLRTGWRQLKYFKTRD